MEVLIKEKRENCHCPVTGRIGNILFNNIPCLMTLTNNPKTKYTIEAISLNDGKDWIGINQIKANKYVEFLLRSNLLSKIIICKDIKRERKVGNSRIDFIINNNILLEVKTPLIILPLKEKYITNKIEYKNNSNLVSTTRFFKHLDELSNERKRSIMISFYMFEAKPFIPPAETNKIANKVFESAKSGVEFWQVNCKFEKDGIKLIDYYKMFNNK